MTPTLTIRPETVHDYAAIAAVNMHAFSPRAGEALIVTLHRHRAEFDPELSLVAEMDGQIVGHVLFSLRVVRLMGENVQSVNLAPIAIEPTFQRQGIGGKLIAEGNAVAKAKGYALSFLLGHPWYYPRFGYKTYAYGSSRVSAPPGNTSSAHLEQRGVAESDIPALRDLWLHEEGNVDFAIDPGHTLLDWVSPHPDIKASLFTREGEIVGYTRIHTADPAKPRYFLARSAASARAMVTLIAAQADTLELPLHPASASAAAFGTPEYNAWDAGMALSLAPNPFDEYYTRLQAGTRPPGRPIWPVEFDLD